MRLTTDTTRDVALVLNVSVSRHFLECLSLVSVFKVKRPDLVSVSKIECFGDVSVLRVERLGLVSDFRVEGIGP